jgi:hypothetical protein
MVIHHKNGIPDDNRIENLEMLSAEVHNALDKNGDLTITCLFCHNIIINPRMEKGRIVQKFCNSKCHDTFHNKIKGGTTKEMIEFHAREILKLIGGFND